MFSKHFFKGNQKDAIMILNCSKTRVYTINIGIRCTNMSKGAAFKGSDRLIF